MICLLAHSSHLYHWHGASFLQEGEHFCLCYLPISTGVDSLENRDNVFLLDFDLTDLVIDTDDPLLCFIQAERTFLTVIVDVKYFVDLVLESSRVVDVFEVTSYLGSELFLLLFVVRLSVGYFDCVLELFSLELFRYDLVSLSRGIYAPLPFKLNLDGGVY